MTVPDNAGTRIPVALSFHRDLTFFLKREEQLQPVRRLVTRKSSVKDVIESCGVPHAEVDLIVANDRSVDFSFQIESDTEVAIYPVGTDPFPGARLQKRDIAFFVADGHLGKLARDLRLLGIDVAYDRDASDPDLLITMRNEHRALLTRDRRLLMHGVVQTGYYPRSQNPLEQTLEVIGRFELKHQLKPFTRCLRCNGLLISVSKEQVLSELEPLTRLYFDQFQQCPCCHQTYWGGSHLGKLQDRVEAILERL
jgi:uncharacterized protein with PIN domain